MSLRYTYHGNFEPRAADSWRSGTLPGQAGDAVVVADGAASAALAQAGYYRIVATGYSLIRIAADAANGVGGEYWPADHIEVRYLAAGQKIGVSAA